MKGLRKVIIGIAFIAGGTFVAYAGIRNGSDLVGIATVIGALAGGTFGIIWGNAQEHKSQTSSNQSNAQ